MQSNMTVDEEIMKAGITHAGASAPDKNRLNEILKRAKLLRGLPLEDAASLLHTEDPEHIRLISEAAGEVKEAVFGPRVVLFAPLYLSNYCGNDCLYCGFRRSNATARRKAVSPEEAVEQANILSKAGFKRIILVAGEHPLHSSIDYLVKVAEAIYSQTDIHILHINSAPLSVENFRTIKSAGYGVYQCFQETYHPETYAVMHPVGMKRDYSFRLNAMDRALEAGFGDVGIGALLGLYDYRFDALATIAHSKHLEERFGAAAHTISVPRLRYAEGAALKEPPAPVSDTDFKKIVAVYRLSVPYAGVVISTREPEAVREECLKIGASQISAGSSVEPGGYGKTEHSTAQFSLHDNRDIVEMAEVIAKAGLLPSLCTACYRNGRQGAAYHDAVISGGMHDRCTVNAVLSLKEYILDTGNKSEALEGAVRRFTEALPDDVRPGVQKKLAGIAAGDRDVHI
jgi:2-iminoacetate synthase